MLNYGGDSHKGVRNNCGDREDRVLFERLKYENEQNAKDKDDAKLIRSIVHLENQQFMY